MIYLYGTAGIALIISLIFSREKTVKALKAALAKFMKLIPPFLVLTILVSLTLYFIPEDLITRALGKANLLPGTVIASLIGSIALIPGFIVFPLCGLLRSYGVDFTVLSAFTTTLMMVGILTFPVEREYLGFRLTLARNLSGFIIAMIVALFTGLFFGEIHL